MPEMNLRQPAFTYSACGTFTYNACETEYKKSKKQKIHDILIKTN